MKVLGIIAEYNPFHNGHLHHLKESQAVSQCTHTVAVMSGHFLQRGEPALLDKWSRARAAVANGVDLVLELPFAYSCQSAEIFAYGGVRILKDLQVVDSLAFGSESDDLSALRSTARKLAYESPAFQESLRRHLKEGFSYPKARELALSETHRGLSIPKKSNDILGIEYLKWLIRLESTMEPVLIKRHKVEYHDTKPQGDIASATYIRNMVLHNEEYREDLEALVPKATLQEMDRYLEQNPFNHLNRYFDHLRLDLMRSSEQDLRRFGEIREGLEYKLKANAYTAEHVDALIQGTLSKRYTQTRLSRILCHLLHGYDMVKPLTFFVDRDFTPYVRVLAFNDRGRSLLRRIRKETQNPVITNVGRSRRLLDPRQKECLDLDILSSNLFFLKGNPSRIQEDYYRNPEYLST